MTTKEALDILLWTNPAAGKELPKDVKQALALLSGLEKENSSMNENHYIWAMPGELWFSWEGKVYRLILGEGDRVASFHLTPYRDLPFVNITTTTFPTTPKNL